jgi:hypothetical protein
MNVADKSWFCGNYPTLTIISCICMWRVDLPDGTHTLTQEEEGAASGEVNQIGVHQDLDQSPEEPKASVESGEGKHRNHLTFLD